MREFGVLPFRSAVALRCPSETGAPLSRALHAIGATRSLPSAFQIRGAEGGLLDFAGGGAGNRVHEDDLPRALVAGQTALAVGDQVLSRDVCSLAPRSATGASPQRSSGTPKTVQSSTAGWLASAVSTSEG